MDTEKPKCFVMMPFAAPHDGYYTKIYAKAIEAAGLTPTRGDSLFRSSAIMGDIWRLVQESEVLLADLTGRNPNVFYELGLAHAIGKPVVLIAETMDDVPFDLRGLRVLTFNRHDPDWGLALRAAITSSLKETMSDVLSAVSDIYKQRASQAPVSNETPLESHVRRLSEEITALRRELSSKFQSSPFEDALPELLWLKATLGNQPTDAQWKQFTAYLRRVPGIDNWPMAQVGTELYLAFNRLPRPEIITEIKARADEAGFGPLQFLGSE